ncbi:hypothetical protein TSUD_372830 [Trifolium subterraneum]|uniref:Uncharacterized protein n=1 Tax=Trifolium subterraneum TaxID=3900 RepID=A0A2Z6NAR8_TRISU|nr:hypothetical protein TSUD_372830 [Trifolium subterraneum]
MALKGRRPTLRLKNAVAPSTTEPAMSLTRPNAPITEGPALMSFKSKAFLLINTTVPLIFCFFLKIGNIFNDFD